MNTARKEFMFLTSTLVPSSVSPLARTDTLASQRRLPSSMLPSLTPIQTSTWRSRCMYSRASAALRMSGSETISMSGTPQRLRLTRELVEVWMSPLWISLPVSSSRWTRVIPTTRCLPSTSRARWPPWDSGRSYCEIW